MARPLKLIVKKEGRLSYVADSPDLPGAPYVGRGTSPIEALGMWFANHARERFNVDVKFEDKS